MKKISALIFLFLFIPQCLYAAQQTWADGDDLATIRTAIQANDTELYAQYATQWTAGEVYVADTQMVAHGGNTFICILGHTASIAGAVGNEPGVGDSWTTNWKYYGSDRYQLLLAEGPFVDGDKTKLDGIETGARVAVYFQNDCSTVTTGICIDTDSINNRIYFYNSGVEITSLDWSYMSNAYQQNIVLESDVDDTAVTGATTDPISSNWAYVHANGIDPHGTASATLTFTNKTVDFASNDLTMPYELPITILTPADADDPMVDKVGRAITLTSIDCIALGGGTISVDLQECDANGATCVTTGATIATCGATSTTDATLTNAAIDSGDVLRIFLGAPSGTVDQVMIKINGTQVM